MTTRELLKLQNTGHPGINSLFAKAHSADWDFENDVDWSVPVAPDDPLVAHGWAAYGKTPTFQALPEPVKAHATRRAVGRMLTSCRSARASRRTSVRSWYSPSGKRTTATTPPRRGWTRRATTSRTVAS